MLARCEPRLNAALVRFCVSSGSSWRPFSAQPAELPSAVVHSRELTASPVVTSEIPLSTERQRLVILGTGWAAARLLRDINVQAYDLTLVSPRNHMVFTPLLASTAVGTLEFRSVAFPVRDIQPALAWPQNLQLSASATSINPAEKTVTCLTRDQQSFTLKYDQLVVATGAAGSTFGIPGVREHAHFLRDVSHAAAIRSRIIRNLGLAGTPGRTLHHRQALLHIVIVGGGPTGVEVAGEIVDFVDSDIRRLYPAQARDIRVTLVEARDILGSFDVTLREYAARHLTRSGVRLVKGIVQEVKPEQLLLTDGSVLDFGLCVWSTGVGPTPFVESLPFAKTNVGRLAVNGQMQVLIAKGQDVSSPSSATEASIEDAEDAEQAESGLVPCEGVYALGDCAGNIDGPLPALAQVAEQQGRYMARLLNKFARNGYVSEVTREAPFEYRHLGSMASIGRHSAVLEVGKTPNSLTLFRGFNAWVAWRSAYLTRLGSLKKRIEVASNWTLTLLFGRDTSRW